MTVSSIRNILDNRGNLESGSSGILRQPFPSRDSYLNLLYEIMKFLVEVIPIGHPLYNSS